MEIQFIYSPGVPSPLVIRPGAAYALIYDNTTVATLPRSEIGKGISTLLPDGRRLEYRFGGFWKGHLARIDGQEVFLPSAHPEARVKNFRISASLVVAFQLLDWGVAWKNSTNPIIFALIATGFLFPMLAGYVMCWWNSRLGPVIFTTVYAMNYIFSVVTWIRSGGNGWVLLFQTIFLLSLLRAIPAFAQLRALRETGGATPPAIPASTTPHEVDKRNRAIWKQAAYGSLFYAGVAFLLNTSGSAKTPTLLVMQVFAGVIASALTATLGVTVLRNWSVNALSWCSTALWGLGLFISSFIAGSMNA